MGASARRFDIEQAGIGVLAEAFPHLQAERARILRISASLAIGVNAKTCIAISAATKKAGVVHFIMSILQRLTEATARTIRMTGSLRWRMLHEGR